MNNRTQIASIQIYHQKRQGQPHTTIYAICATTSINLHNFLRQKPQINQLDTLCSLLERNLKKPKKEEMHNISFKKFATMGRGS